MVAIRHRPDVEAQNLGDRLDASASAPEDCKEVVRTTSLVAAPQLSQAGRRQTRLRETTEHRRTPGWAGEGIEGRVPEGLQMHGHRAELLGGSVDVDGPQVHHVLEVDPKRDGFGALLHHLAVGCPDRQQTTDAQRAQRVRQGADRLELVFHDVVEKRQIVGPSLGRGRRAQLGGCPQAVHGEADGLRIEVDAGYLGTELGEAREVLARTEADVENPSATYGSQQAHECRRAWIREVAGRGSARIRSSGGGQVACAE